MNFQNDRYTLRMAEQQDDAGIREIFESGSFPGGLSVQYLRPSPLASFAADGEDVRMLIVHDNEQNRTAAVGGAVVRTEFVSGKPERCAYLTGLKIHADYQKQLYFIARAYQYLGEQLADCKCCYSTILDDNRSVIRMLEKKHKNMPEYRYLGRYTTFCFHGGRRFLRLETGRTDGFPELMQDYFSQLDLTPVHPELAGFGEKHFYALRENGKIIACCFAGNQRALKQYRMNAYGGAYRLLPHLPTRLLGYPALPKAGSIIRHAVVSYLYIAQHDPKLCRKFLRSVAAAEDCDLLLWGGFENHPLLPAMQKMKAIHYGSRLYEVIWNGAPQIHGKIGMECALL
ncbi:MAG: hypothetical protein IKQ91_07640 [Oscillospiraceae bacterium]|nr:hypothetical protein [Oscillospiraceae bacterium]